MKPVLLWTFSLGLAASLWGQANPDNAPSPQTAEPAQRTASAVPASTADYISWRLQRMRQLEDEIGAMRTKLDELKTNTARLKDPAVKKQVELETELLGMMLSHEEEVNAMLRLPSAPLRTNSAAQNYRRRMVPRQMPGQQFPAMTPSGQAAPPVAPTTATEAPKSAPQPEHQ
jgi:hypothetical protein